MLTDKHLNLYGNVEIEFVIDEDMAVPGVLLTGSGLSSLDLLEREYVYVSDLETFTFEGQQVTSYGYVDINIDDI